MYKSKLKGFSLVELILAIGIFTMAMSSFAFLGIESYKTLHTSQSRIIASQKSKEIVDLIMLVKNESWRYIVDNTDDGEKYILLDTDGTLSVESGRKDGGGYTYFFTIGMGYRDENGSLVEEGGLFEDPSTRVINLTIFFDDAIFGTSEFNTSIYINNWNVLRFSQPFDVTLPKGFLPDWCEPQHTHSRHSLDWWTIGSALKAHKGNAYMVSAEWFLGRTTFLHAKITPSSPPEVNIEAEYSLGTGNDIYVEGNYAYIATDSSQELVSIFNISEKPYTPVGSYHTDSSTGATTIYIEGEYGFVGYENKIDIFKLSDESFVGRVPIGSSSARVEDIVVKDGYVFVGMRNHNRELSIVDIADIENPQVVSEINLNNQNTDAIFVSDDGDIVYVATSGGWFTRPEFSIVNTENKTNLIKSANVRMNELRSINDMVVVEDKAIIAGAFDLFSSNDNYIVLNLKGLDTPERCGGLRIPWGIRALDVVEFEGKLYSYILSLDPNYEIQIVEGGSGGGDYAGEGYMPEENYFSEIFVLGTTNTRLYSANIYGEVPEGTSLKVQLKIGGQEDLSDATWFGPDGTNGTYFLLGETPIDLPTKQGQYLQYRVEMTSDSPELSPILDKIEIVYD